MLFAFWQLKTIAFGLLLASCVGHKLLRTCQRDYCYERSVESRNIETDYLRKLYGDENRRVDAARETENLDNISRELSKIRLDQFSRREPYQLHTEIDDRRLESAFNRRVEETPKIQHAAKLVLDRRQEINTDRFRTSMSRLNERENRQEGNELRDENQEPHRFNDRRSMRQQEIFRRSEESQAERKINYVDRQSRRSSDRTIEKERNLLQRRERNPEVRVNRESLSSNEEIFGRNPESKQNRHQIKEDRSIFNKVSARSQRENNRDVARHEFQYFETRRFNERISERPNEIRFENLRRERENDSNMDKFRQIRSTEDDLLDTYDSRLDERERKNRRSTEQLSERTRESIQRREESVQQRDRRLEAVNRSSSRLDVTESLSEPLENLRQLNKRGPLDENRRSVERRQDRQVRSEILEFERHHMGLSEQRETSRRLNEQENERSSIRLSNIEDKNDRQHGFKNFDENRKSSRRSIEREERNVQRRIGNDVERERSSERVRDNDNRRVTSRQNNQEQRYDINERLTEREFTQRQVEDTRKRENNSRQLATTQKEQRLEGFNRRGKNRFDNLSERENILNRNRDFQRSIERRTESDEENFKTRNENVNHMRSSIRSESRNIYRLSDKNRRSDERCHENGLLNPFSRRSSISKSESVEQRYIGGSEFTPRREELDERDNERNINSALDRSRSSIEIQRSHVRAFENVDNIRGHDNQNLQYDTNRDLETRMSNERRDIIESTRNNHQMVLRKGEATKLQPRQDENKREQREDRGNHRFETLSNRNVENRRDFQLIVDEYKETPTDSLKSRKIAYVQGILLAFVIMKTLNGKNKIKCQISQKFQEANGVLGF